MRSRAWIAQLWAIAARTLRLIAPLRIVKSTLSEHSRERSLLRNLIWLWWRRRQDVMLIRRRLGLRVATPMLGDRAERLASTSGSEVWIDCSRTLPSER